MSTLVANIQLPRPFVFAVAGLVLAACVSLLIPARPETTQPRERFNSFPMHIGEWRGREGSLDRPIIQGLRLDDYVIADYRTKAYSYPVNFYVAYYRSQRAGASAHSPRTCIPAGGWRIEDLQEISIPQVLPGGGSLVVNRLLIALGDRKQLVYYWFQQRGRQLTGEYSVKFYLFWDALRQNRTDGALVRLYTTIGEGEAPGTADARLTEFARAVYPTLGRYIPD